MAPFRYHDDDSTSKGMLYLLAGAVAGFAAGVVISQRSGALRELPGKIRDLFTGDEAEGLLGDEEFEAYDDDEFDLQDRSDRSGFTETGVGIAAASDDYDDLDVDGSLELEERVLEAFSNDPILQERPIDIGAISEGIIELTGWVNADSEVAHAVTVARGVPGVDTVVNRVAVRPEEDLRDATARKYEDGDPTLTEAHWEGQSVGTGRRRQGNSSEFDRHADPRPELEDRWNSESAALDEAVDDIAGFAEAKKPPVKRGKKGDRAGGSAVAPTGVPKADHVTEPTKENGLAD
ncbi:MAG: BON domain-containing protein [Gemmatimonadaceae bacterium]|nr:BON domain-containing protein [Gemmatimonadaceae bacterium]